MQPPAGSKFESARSRSRFGGISKMLRRLLTIRRSRRDDDDGEVEALVLEETRIIVEDEDNEDDQRQPPQEAIAAASRSPTPSILPSRRGRDRAGSDRTLSGVTSITELTHWLHMLNTMNDSSRDLTDLEEQEALFSRHDGDVEDDRQLSREELLEKIRKKKAVIERVRCQPWPMRRKRRTLTLAQKYLQRHEAKVSKLHLWSEEFKRKWKKFKRWLANISIYLIPWEAKIKTIESHFGSVVSSYFTFLRWIFWVNMIMTLFMVSFIVIPECLADAFADEDRRNHTDTNKRKNIEEEEQESADYLQTIWDYKGYLSVSPLFYGYYSNKDYILSNFKYQLPLAYFMVNIFTLGYSFFAILKKMAANTRLSKLTGGKTEQYPFAWKIFTGWDYSIGNSETAANTVMANANKLREAIVDYKTKQKQKFAWIRLLMRMLANVIIICMIAGSAYTIYAVVEQSKLNLNPSAFEQNQVALLVSFITLIFPNFFELVSRALEGFHPRTALRVHLGRILALYLLNFYTLIIALLTKINALRAEQEALLNATGGSSTIGLAAITVGSTSSASTLSATSTFASTTIFDGDDMIAEEASRFVRHLLDRNGSAMTMANETSLLHVGAALTSGLVSTAAVLGSNFSALLKSAFESKSAASSSSTIPNRQRRENGDESTVWTTTTSDRDAPVSTSTMSAAATTSAFDGPLLWAVVHPDLGTVGVNKAKAYIEVSTFATPPPPSQPPPSSTPRPPERIVANQITQRERHLQRLCWETWVGQEIAKLITMDLVMTIASVLLVDFFRGLWVRYCHRWWCWNLETTFPEYGEFKVAENVLHIINNQGMIWLGIFFCPLLPAVNNVKLVILMYVRGWAVMTCNVPATQVFRASRSSNFYLLLLLLMLFLCTLPVGFLIASYRPSTTCGPFSSIDRFYYIVTNRLESQVPSEVYKHINMVASPGVIIPVLLMLGLIIYFLISLIRGLREANQDLQKQLIHERTEEKRKIYQLAGGGKQDRGSGHPTRSALALPETKKIDTSYLPPIEQKRREAWRMRLTLDEENIGGESEVVEDDDDEYTPQSDAPTPIVKKKRSLRSLLTPAISERDVASLITVESARPPAKWKDDEKEKSTFNLFDEENRKSLIDRWKRSWHGRGRQASKEKIPPLASMDIEDDTLLRSSPIDSPIDFPSLESDPKPAYDIPPAYDSSASFKPMVPIIVKDSPSTTASISSSVRYPATSSRSHLTPSTSGGHHHRALTSSHSNPSDPESGVISASISFVSSPPVALASSAASLARSRDQRSRAYAGGRSVEPPLYSRLLVGGIEANNEPPQPPLKSPLHSRGLRPSRGSGHFRSNIEDEEDDDLEVADALLQLPEIPKKPPPAQRKFQKSVSSTFLPWPVGQSAARQQQRQVQPKPIAEAADVVSRKSSLVGVEPTPTTGVKPKAKFTISVSCPDGANPSEEKGGSPSRKKPYIIRQTTVTTTTTSQPEAPRRKSSKVSLMAPPKLDVVAETEAMSPTEEARRAFLDTATSLSSFSTTPKRHVLSRAQTLAGGIVEPPPASMERTGGSSRRPSADRGNTVRSASDRRPSSDRGVSDSDIRTAAPTPARRSSKDRGTIRSPRRPSADRGRSQSPMKPPQPPELARTKPSVELAGKTGDRSSSPTSRKSSKEHRHPIHPKSGGQQSGAAAVPSIRPPPAVHPGSTVQQYRSPQMAASSSSGTSQKPPKSPRKSSLVQPKP